MPGGGGKPEHIHVVSEIYFTWRKSACKNYCMCFDLLHILTTFWQAACPDSYRGKYRDNEFTVEELGKKYSDDVKSMIAEVTAGGRHIAGFIAESLQSCGGQVILPPGYLRNVYKWVEKTIKIYHSIWLINWILQTCPRRWRCLHSWRSSSWVWPSGKALLGFPTSRGGCRSGHCHVGKTNWKWYAVII